MRRAATKAGLLALSIGLPALPAVAAEPEWPGFTWGTPQARVAEAGPGELILAGERRVIRHAEIAGIPMTLNYRFDSDGLYQVRYFNRARHAVPGDYLADYDAVLERLVAAFGEPETDEREWRNDALQDQPEHHGRAVQVGHLSLLAGWRSERADVVTRLDNEAFRPLHDVLLTDPAH